MKRLLPCALWWLIIGMLMIAGSPAFGADRTDAANEGARILLFPGAGGHLTQSDGTTMAGVAISGFFRMKDMPRGWPSIVGLSFAMTADNGLEDPGPPENTLSIEAWWMLLHGGPFSLGPGGGGTWANFGVDATDFGGLWGVSFVIDTGTEGAPDILITLGDHTDLQKWDFDFQARLEFVKEFDFSF